MRVDRGFTLVELLVAFAMAALVLGVVPVALSKAKDAAQYRSTVRDVITDLRAARNLSIMTGREVSFDVDLAARVFGVSPAVREIPSGLEFDAIFAATEIDAPGRGRIRFFPDGGSTGGSVIITRLPSNDGVRVRVDWLLGRVTQEPRDAIQ